MPRCWSGAYRSQGGRAGVVAWLVLGLVGLEIACEREEPPAHGGPSEPYDVILVVFDTTRADDWSIFDPSRQVTPVVDRIGAEGQRFENAWSLYSVTVPSHISLFTGHAARQPVDHALAADGGAPDDILAEQRFEYRRSSLFTILSRAGYRTYAFAGNDNISPENVEALEAVDVSSMPPDPGEARAHADRILEQYGENQPMTHLREWTERKRTRRIVSRDARFVNEQALAAMREHVSVHAGQRYLLFLNYNDAHDPYFPPAPWDARLPTPGETSFSGNLWSRAQRSPAPGKNGLALSMTAEGLSEADIERARALHLAELSYADHHFGELLAELERLGLMERAIIVATADHGEAFGEGGRMAHGGFGGDDVARALLHVPMVMRFPDTSIEPAVIEQRVDLRDVKPTLLDFLGIEDDSSRGRSLLPLIRGGAGRLREAAPRPQDTNPEAVGENLIGGQDEQTTKRLEEELRALGYVE